jgi:hypothetical protein
MRPGQLILSQIDRNIRLAPVFSRFSARVAVLRLEGMLAKADMRGLEPGCMLEKMGLVTRLLPFSVYAEMLYGLAVFRSGVTAYSETVRQ